MASMLSSKTPLPRSFLSKKREILERLAVPASEYDDLSPKGSVDEEIRDLIDEINEIDGCVTTSSCAGRLSIYLEGEKSHEKKGKEEEEAKTGTHDEEVKTKAGVGGKGGGGRWLYVSHEPLDGRKHESNLAEFFGMQRRSSTLQRGVDPRGERWVHFKFEPMILHILTASLEKAQIVLSAALQAGFRESGAINLVTSNSEPATPMVAVRSMGLALESLVGLQHARAPTCTVTEETLEGLVDVANERFRENTKRIERFRELLKRLSSEESVIVKKNGPDGEAWEDPRARMERKKVEGLKRSREIRDSRQVERLKNEETVDLQLLDQKT